MHSSFQKHLEDQLSEEIKQKSHVSGGDISNAYKIDTAKSTYFVKSSSDDQALKMYEAEAKGLQQIAATKTIATPKVITKGEFEGSDYLVLEFIASKRPNLQDFERLGVQLASLHQAKNDAVFGNDHDNFIGSLPQCNKRHQNWAEYYVQERLVPQLHMAEQKSLLTIAQIPETEILLNRCRQLLGEVPPSLLHGDLWGGNYLITTDGTPYLIDPAVYVGHSEVDIAMTKLFGGFGESFYKAYHEIIPPNENQSELTDIYQLYYLLVHLNLFGSSYLGSVLRILKKYFY
ncbi:fructosamine kinase family protein [Allomuricauda sp. d1]|uniref:fructosamine kinase family protein n=1 Tax=Allomuricauda sp. d1 TaxID=3136725 RepID=UPI0031D1F076